MSLASMIRRVAGGKPRRMSDQDPAEMEEEDDKKATDVDDDTQAEDEDPNKDAEDDKPDADADADTDDDADPAADEDEEADKDMPAKEKAAFAKGRKAERKRIAAILGSKQAETNHGLAAHLAFRTADSPKKALAALKYGGATSAASGLADRMNARGPSRTGRGGEGDVRSADAAKSWDGALAKAGVKLKGAK